MNDVASPAASAVAAGAGAAALATLGLEPQPLFWSLVGASIGLSFAAQTSRGRAVAIFAAVVLACSLLGSWVAQRYMAGTQIERNACACLLAIVFHPLTTLVIQFMPSAFERVFGRREGT